MLWLALALLTIGAVAAIVVPLLRSRSTTIERRAVFDRVIYRDQLAEIARDLGRGVLDAGQAATARLEIERRLLATEESGETETAGATTPVDGITAIALAAAVSAGAVALYLALGSPGSRDQPFASRQVEGAVAQAGHAQGDFAATVDALAAKLKDNPGDAEGWMLLARSQGSLQRWSDAAASYQRALALTGSPEASAAYGEMLVMAADGGVTPAAREAFTAALKGDPGSVAARFYLALADAQAGRAREAVAAWTKLAADAPPDAPWLATVREHLQETARAAGIELPKEALSASVPVGSAGSPATGAAGPSAADVEAAQGMSPEERQAMIRGMVEKLAARLAANPDDAEGWQRLARAYGVLGDKQKAADAAARAAALLAPNP